jgi:hypothetical protein
VLKPAAQDAFNLGLAAAQAAMKIVVTHSMDHPLGRATALWTAMRLRQRHGDLVCDGGLQGNELYAPDDFSRAFDKPRPPVGTGFGFDTVINSLEFQQLT